MITHPGETPARCYVLSHDAGCERWLAEKLTRRCIEFWIPEEETRPCHRAGRRLALATKAPLLPGYAFVRLPDGNLGFEDERVTGLVRGAHGGTRRPVVVPEPVIAALRSQADADGVFREHVRRAQAKPLEQGEQVRVTLGPWAGFLAEVLSLDPRERVRLLLGLLVVKMPVAHVERVGRAA